MKIKSKPRSSKKIRNKAKSLSKRKTQKSVSRSQDQKIWELKLYIAGNTPKSILAFNNLKAICETHLRNQYRIEIIDLIEKPQLAKGDEIFAIPTLVRHLPHPIKKIIGNLSNTDRVLVGLSIKRLGKG